MTANAISAHLNQFTGMQRKALNALRAAIAQELPTARLVIKYGIPTFVVAGVPLIGFSGYKNHNSIFPYGGLVAGLLAKDLARYSQTKGSFHFQVDTIFPKLLLRRLLRQKLTQINSTFPNRKGEYLELYGNGIVKAQGRYRAAKMHGDWVWHRKDGSRLRSGAFIAGKQVGIWITYDRTGKPYKKTNFGP